MRLKTKLTWISFVMALVIALFVLAMIAISKGHFNIGGEISFREQDIAGRMTAGVISEGGAHASETDNDKKMQEIVFDPLGDQTLEEEAKKTWQGLNIMFKEKSTKFTITFTIFNNNINSPLKVGANVDEGKIKNAKISMEPMSTVIMPVDLCEFTITFEVIDSNLSAKIENFDIELTLLARTLDMTDLLLNKLVYTCNDLVETPTDYKTVYVDLSHGIDLKKFVIPASSEGKIELYLTSLDPIKIKSIIEYTEFMPQGVTIESEGIILEQNATGAVNGVEAQVLTINFSNTSNVELTFGELDFSLTFEEIF